MKAICYGRVSSDEQASNYSLPTQITACQMYAEKNAMEVVGVFREDFTGTKPIEERPEGTKAYAMLASGEADTLIVFSMDRLVRPPEEGDEWDVIALIRSLAKLGKVIHRVDKGRMGTSFAEILNSVLDAKSAGDWRRKLIECTTRGTRAKAEAGKYVGGGVPPYGYRHVGERKSITLEIDEDEARIVRLIYEWYLLGDETQHPLSAYQVAKKLSLMGVLSPGVNRKSPQKRTAPTCWTPSSIGNILSNETYVGLWHWGQTTWSGGIHNRRWKKQERSKWAPVQVPAIISREQWDRAQERISENRHHTRPNPKKHYLMQSRLKCGDCNSTLIAYTQTSGGERKPYGYYRCFKAHRGYPGSWRHRDCSARTVRADKLDAEVWEWAKSLFDDPDKLTRGLRKKQAEQDKGTGLLREKLGFIDRQLEGCRQQLANQIALFSGIEVTEETKALFAAQEQTLNEQIHSLKSQRQRYLQKIADCVISNDAIQSLEDTARKMGKEFKKANFEQRRVIIERLDVSGTVFAQEKGRAKVQVTCLLDETKLLEVGRMANGEQLVSYLLQLPVASSVQ